VGIHRGLSNCGGSGTRGGGGERSDVAVATRHISDRVWSVTRLEFSYDQGRNSANFQPKIMVVGSLKSPQRGVYFHIT